jgi:tetratricopeptide (TPR) repeat protein
MSDPPSPSWICAQCGTDGEDAFDVCWKCGAPRDGSEASGFPEGSEVEPEAQAPPKAPRPIYCHECSYRLDGLGAGRCPECGRPFDPALPGSVREVGRVRAPTFDIYQSDGHRIALPTGFNWTGFFFTAIWACGRGLWAHAAALALAGMLAYIVLDMLADMFAPWVGPWPERVGVACGLAAMVLVGRHGNRWCAAQARRRGYRLISSVAPVSLSGLGVSPETHGRRAWAGILAMVLLLAGLLWWQGFVVERAAAAAHAEAHDARVTRHRAALDAAIALAPDDRALRRARAELIALDGATATEDLARLAVLDLLDRAEAEPERALAHLDEAIRIDPGSAEAFLRRSRVHAAAESWDAALDDQEAAIARGGDTPALQLDRARLFQRAGRPDEARDAFAALRRSTGDQRTALVFDGASDHVVCPGLPFDDFDEITIEAWVLGWRGTIAVQGRGGDPANSIWLSLEYTGWESGRGKNHAFSVRDWPETEWMHIALVYDGARQRGYVNGEEIRSTFTPRPGPIDRAAPLLLGSWSSKGGGEGRYRDGAGVLGSVRVSTIARYREPFTPERTLPADDHTVLLFDPDQSSGALLPDRSGHGRDGAIHGPWWLPEGGTDGGS